MSAPAGHASASALKPVSLLLSSSSCSPDVTQLRDLTHFKRGVLLSFAFLTPPVPPFVALFFRPAGGSNSSLLNVSVASERFLQTSNVKILRYISYKTPSFAFPPLSPCSSATTLIVGQE